MKNLTNALMAQAPLSALVLMCVVGTALAEDGPPRCEKKTEALLEGRCVHKTRCPAGLTPDGSACAPVPTCDEGTHWVKPRRACVEYGKECGAGSRWVASKQRCVVKGAECKPGLRWVEHRNRCVVKGAECNDGLTWIPNKNRCVVRGTECRRGLVWNAALERCEVRRD